MIYLLLSCTETTPHSKVLVVSNSKVKLPDGLTLTKK